MRRPKPLLLLAYLALEGPKSREHLAELFWPDADKPLASLSITLSRLRPVLGDTLAASGVTVATSVSSDVQTFLGHIERATWDAAVKNFGGHFLGDGLPTGLGGELQDWAYQTRDFLASRACEALLRLGERAASVNDFRAAAIHAERALHLGHPAGLEPEALVRTHDLLMAGGSPLAASCRREASELGLRLTRTQEQARRQLRSAAALTPTTFKRLPSRNKTFVGRDLELARLLELLGRHEVRLVTLTGMAGVGKTQLGLYAAEESLRRGQFANGATFVDVAATASSELPFGIANAFGVTLQAGADLAEQLANAVAERELLVVIDNFEHLLEEAALLGVLTLRCPNLKLLVTSRERLNLEEEWPFPLGGLAFPESTLPDTEDSVQDAPHLFIMCAKRAHPDFVPTERDLAAIAQICRRVEGLPLAIELTAAWVRALPCEAIAAELEANPAFFVTPARNASDRHQSIWGALEHSWAMLKPSEAAALRRLAVFRGGFSREAASDAAAVPLATLVSLIDKSLLRVSATGRYDRHPLVYSFSRGKLTQVPDEEAQVSARHADFYTRLLASMRNTVDGPEGKAVLDKLDEELTNVELAWHHDLGGGRLQALEVASEVLKTFFKVRGRALEGTALFSAAIVTLGGREGVDSTLGKLLAYQASLLHALGQLDEAREAAERGVRVLEPCGPHVSLAEAYIVLANIEAVSGALLAAQGHLTRALSLSGSLGDTAEEATVLGLLAMIEGDLGNYAAAEEAFAASIALARQLGNQLLLTGALYNLGAMLLISGQLAKAEGPLRESLVLCFETNHKRVQPYIFHSLGILERRKGDPLAAERYLQEALVVAEASGDQELMSAIYSDLAITVYPANYSLAAVYLLRALQGAHRAGALPLLLKNLIDVAQVWLEQNRVEAAVRVLSGIGEHPALTQEDKQRRAALLGRAAQQLSAERAQAPAEGGGQRDLDDVVAGVAAELAAQALPLPHRDG